MRTSTASDIVKLVVFGRRYRYSTRMSRARARAANRQPAARRMFNASRTPRCSRPVSDASASRRCPLGLRILCEILIAASRMAARISWMDDDPRRLESVESLHHAAGRSDTNLDNKEYLRFRISCFTVLLSHCCCSGWFLWNRHFYCPAAKPLPLRSQEGCYIIEQDVDAPSIIPLSPC